MIRLDYPSSYLIVCGLKKNKRPKEDPSLSLSRRRRSPAKKKGTKKKKVKGKKKHQTKTKKNVGRNNKSKPKQEVVEDLSDVRTGLIWPWIASITISGEVTCTGFIISSRIVITATRCFPTLDSNR